MNMNRRNAICCLLPFLLLLTACGLPVQGPARAAAAAQSATATRRPPSLPTATLTPAPSPTPVTFRAGGPLSLSLPPGYRALQAEDGGIFVYHESLPGFLVLYPVADAAAAAATLTRLLNNTPGVARSEPPLEVDAGGRTFLGLFVETRAGDRLFLAASEGTPTWGLVVQGPVEHWPTLAAGFNQVLIFLHFEEE